MTRIGAQNSQKGQEKTDICNAAELMRENEASKRRRG